MNFKINIPNNVSLILNKLNKSGFEAYVVGGCVRDSILCRTPHDWDICTSATTNEIINTFRDYRIIETGLKHGTVTILIHGEPYEVTTYRIDGNYSYNRHHDDVIFTNILTEDLKRRDFTINAMAYNNEVGLIDPFNGIDDIKNKKIRCVGNPDDRFSEDALRILRAWRFCCQLNFNIDYYTSISMYNNIKLLDNISIERIQTEFIKAFNCTSGFVINQVLRPQFFNYIVPEFESLRINQNNHYHIYTVDIHTLNALLNVKKCDLITRLAVLFHDIGKPQCYQDDENNIRHFKGHGKVSADLTDNIMKRLKFDNYTREKVIELVYYHDSTFEIGEKYIKRWLNKISVEQFKRLIEVKKADIKAQNPKYYPERYEKITKISILLNNVLEQNSCFTLKDLKINGNDIMNILNINPCKEIGIYLEKLLNMVINGEINNNKEDLINELKKGMIK